MSNLSSTPTTTEFGKLLRIIRVNSGDSSKEMARKLCLSTSYLSAIENGKRNIPMDLGRLLCEAYPLSDLDREKLRTAMLQSSTTVKLNLTDYSEKKQKVIIALAQADLPEETLDRISELIGAADVPSDVPHDVPHEVPAN